MRWETNPLIMWSDRVACVGMDPKGVEMTETRKSKGGKLNYGSGLMFAFVIVLHFYQSIVAESHEVTNISQVFKIWDLEQFILSGGSNHYLRASCWFIRKTNIFSSGFLSDLWQLQYGSIMVCCIQAIWKFPYLAGFRCLPICNRKQCIAMDERLVLCLPPDDTWNEKKKKKENTLAATYAQCLCIQEFSARTLSSSF